METVYELTKNKLIELWKINIIYESKKISILERLKKIPRTWKSIRIEKYWLNLKKQSLYSHIISLAYMIDFLIEKKYFYYNKKLLSDLCVFHDLSEVIIWDIPDFTWKEYLWETIINKSKKNELEIYANHIILQNLSKDLKYDFVNYIDFVEKFKNKNLINLFEMIDKFEPIISVRRYIYYFKNEIIIDNFIYAMRDFFDNPKVIKHSINEQFKTIIKFLQKKNNAKKYYQNWNEIFENLDKNLREFLIYSIEINMLVFID